MSYELITGIFNNLEVRGIDASGVWGTEAGSEGKVIYQKEAVRSSFFVNDPFWGKLSKINTNLLLIHARATSKGGGNAIVNANNHPFVTEDKRIGIIHNGTIEEAHFLRQKYETKSETDSECLLRVYEHGFDESIEQIPGVSKEIMQRLSGIKDIWSYISTGAMAVAIGERFKDESRGLILFRNDKRPIWIADLRDVLGQIFFFSSPGIWFSAISENTSFDENIFNHQKLIEMPSNEVWFLKINKNNGIVSKENVNKFRLHTKLTNDKFDKGDYKKIKNAQLKLEVLSEMDESDSKIIPKKTVKQLDSEMYQLESSYRTDHESLCESMSQLIDDISVSANNLSIEGSMSLRDYDQLLETLSQTKVDLESILQILNS